MKQRKTTMIVIKTPKSREDFKTYYHLRYHVLRESLGLPKGSEKDDYEPISTHYIAVDDSTGEIVGTVKWYEKATGIARLSHLAVSEKYQKKGIGKLLVKTAEDDARNQGYHLMGTLTRLSAVDFYERCGYEPKGLTTELLGRLQTMWLEKKLDGPAV
jgi:GNAT superfamily N-acetyltransferase